MLTRWHFHTFLPQPMGYRASSVLPDSDPRLASARLLPVTPPPQCFLSPRTYPGFLIMLTRQHYLWMCVLSFSPISQPSLPKATALPSSLLLKLFIHFIQLCIQLTVTACHVCAGEQGRKCEWERQFSLVVEMLKVWTGVWS